MAVSDVKDFAFEPVAEQASKAAASALHKIGPLVDTLSAAKAFEAIAAMSEISDQAAIEYEKAAIAMLQQEIEIAERNILRANRLADELHKALDGHTPIPLPDYIQRAR